MPIGNTFDVVIQQDDLIVLGPPSAVDVTVDIGPRGNDGTQLYSGPFDPNTLTFEEFENIFGDIPRLRDLFVRTDEGSNYGSFYQFTNVPGSDQWEIVIDLIDVFSLFLFSNPDYIILPRSGGTGVNNGTKTITIGGNFRTLGSFPLDFGLSGSTVLALPTSGSVAVLQDKLNVFASTTSTEFASVITDETGTGQVVFNTSPNITTSLTTNSSSFNLIDTNATTVNFAGGATLLNISSGSGSTTINNDLNVLGSITGNLLGNSTTASSLENAVDISLSGDVSGSASFDGSGSVVINAIIQPDSVELGADTVGNYVQSAVSGEGIDVTGTGESANLIITNTGVLSIFGTENEVSVSASSGSVVVGLPETINVNILGSASTVTNVPSRNVYEKTESYTLELSDAQGIIEFNSASAMILTILEDSSVDFPIGSYIDIVQTGSAEVDIQADGAATVYSKDSNTKTSGPYSRVYLYKNQPNSWILTGDLSP